MRTPAEIIKEARISSIIFKNNIEILRLHFKETYLTKWNVNLDSKKIEEYFPPIYFDISQNKDSLTLLWESQFFPDAKTHFFLELINTYQNLKTSDENKHIPYYSYSHAFTSYCLKLLNKYKLIEIVSFHKIEKNDLSVFQQAFGMQESDKKNLRMYDVFFLKKRNLTEEDLPFLKQMAKLLQVDFSQYDIIKKKGTIFFRLNKKYQKWKIPNSFQREQIRNILFYIKEEIFRNLKNKKKREEMAEILKIVKKYSK